MSVVGMAYVGVCYLGERSLALPREGRGLQARTSCR